MGTSGHRLCVLVRSGIDLQAKSDLTLVFVN